MRSLFVLAILTQKVMNEVSKNWKIDRMWISEEFIKFWKVVLGIRVRDRARLAHLLPTGSIIEQISM